MGEHIDSAFNRDLDAASIGGVRKCWLSGAMRLLNSGR
jgi:hypothetical protein